MRAGVLAPALGVAFRCDEDDIFDGKLTDRIRGEQVLAADCKRRDVEHFFEALSNTTREDTECGIRRDPTHARLLSGDC